MVNNALADKEQEQLSDLDHLINLYKVKHRITLTKLEVEEGPILYGKYPHSVMDTPPKRIASDFARHGAKDACSVSKIEPVTKGNSAEDTIIIRTTHPDFEGARKAITEEFFLDMQAKIDAAVPLETQKMLRWGQPDRAGLGTVDRNPGKDREATPGAGIPATCN